MDMNKNRYEKPVQTPSRGAEVANPDCVTIEQKMKTTAARCPIPQNGMMNNRTWPKDMNKNRYEKPVQTPSRGAEVAKHDCVTIEQRMKTTAAGCPTPQNGMMNNRNLPKDMNKTRYERPVQALSRGAEVAKPDCVTIEQRMKTTAAEVCWNLADKAEPSRYQETAVVAKGVGTGGTTNVRGRSIDCNARRTTVRTLPTNCSKFMEPISARVSPVVAETAHTDGTGVMQYQWNDRKSVETTEMQMPRNYLEIPEPRLPRLPRVFLDLAEEARNVQVLPFFVTVMVDSPPVLKKRASRTTGVSTEMIPNMNYTGRREPVDRSGPVGPLSTTEQPVLLGLNTDERGNASTGPVGPDINAAGRGEPVDRSGPVGPQSTTEQPVLLGLDTDERGNTPAGPVGPDVISAGRVEQVDRRCLVGPQNRTEQSVFLGLDADQVGHVTASPVDPDVMMYQNQSVTDGPVGQDKTRHPVGTEGMLAVNDSDRPTTGGPVGRVFKLGPLGPSRMSSLDELNQPLAVGPVGQPFMTSPLCNHVRESDYKQTNQINSGPEGSTGIQEDIFRQTV